MNARSLLAAIQNTAYELQEDYKASWSRELKNLNSALGNVSLDTTVNEPMQRYMLLYDVANIIDEVEAGVSRREISAKYRDDLNAKINKALDQYREEMALEFKENEHPNFLIMRLMDQISTIEKGLIEHKNNFRFTQLAELENSPNWEREYYPDRTLAARKLIAQEFYRLIIPYQPETLLAKDSTQNMYVVSNQMTNCANLGEKSLEELRADFIVEKYQGLGRILILNLLLNEVDSSLKNLFVDNDTDNIIKRYSDTCFAGLSNERFKISSQITTADIANLPLVLDYRPHNWLDIYKRGRLQPDYLLFDTDQIIFNENYKDSAAFRREINETLLSLLLMPENFVQTFIKAYIVDPVEIDLLTKELISRSTQLRKAALDNPSFQTYIQSSKAEKHLEACMVTMNEFKPVNEIKLIQNPLQSSQEFRNEFNKLRDEIIKLAHKTISAQHITQKQETNLAVPLKVSHKSVFLPQLKNVPKMCIGTQKSDLPADLKPPIGQKRIPAIKPNSQKSNDSFY